MSPPEIIPHRPFTTGIRALVGHYGTSLLGQSLTLGLGIVTGVLSARLLGPLGRGEYVAITIWPMGIAMLLSFGINQAVAFNVGRRLFTVSEIATASAVIGVMQSVLTILVGLVVVHFVLANYSSTVRLLGIIFVLLTPVYLLGGLPANFFLGKQDLLRYNTIVVMAPLSYAAGLVGLFFSHKVNLNSVVFFQLVGYVVALVVGLAMVASVLKPRFQWNALAIPRLVDYGWRTQATNLANYFNQRIDQLVLSLLVPPRQLGFYAVAVTLSTAVTIFPVAAGIVTFSKGANQGSEDAKVTIGVGFRASLFWLLICCTVLYAISPFLIRAVFGEAFGGSILACRILLPGAFMIGLKQVLYNGANALGRPGLPSCAEGVSIAVTAIGLYLLVPRYGYIGAAVVSSVAYTVSFVVMLGMAHQLLGLNIFELFVGRRRAARVES
jgi:O-antigen/teichoic acid export membrane protein